MIRRLTATLLLLAFTPDQARAEPAAPADEGIFAELEGVWASEGQAFGAPARSRMEWSRDLAGKFLKLSYRIDMSPTGRSPATFEGIAFYEAKAAPALRGFWADNSGDLHPIAASVEARAILSTWGAEGGKLGRTRYELTDEGDVIVTDWIMTANGWKQFNQNRFRRVSKN